MIRSGEAREPGAIPTAILLVAATLIFYLLLNFAMIIAVGSGAVATFPAPAALAMGRILHGGVDVVGAIGVVALLLVSNRFDLLAAIAVVFVLAPYPALSAAVLRTAPATRARAAGAVGAISTGHVFALSLLIAMQATG